MPTQPSRYRRVSPDTFAALLTSPTSRLTFHHASYQADRPRAYDTGSRTLGLHLLWFFVKGSFAGLAQGERVAIEPGTLLWMSAGATHTFQIPAGITQFSFRPQIYSGKKRIRLERDYRLVKDAWELRPLLEQLLSEIRHPQPFGEHRIKNLFSAICISAMRNDARPRARQNNFSQTQRIQLEQFLAEHIRQDIRPADLAGVLRLSPDYFTRLFRNSFGVPPRIWLVRERIRYAEQLMTEEKLNVSETAYELGYRNVNLFSRQFKAVYGKSPKPYQKEN